MWGIYSNHPLDDENVYDDDVILHASDQDQLPYYRPMSTLQDSPFMLGNCKHAQPGFGRNEMYPCFDESVTCEALCPRALPMMHPHVSTTHSGWRTPHHTAH